MNNIVIEIRSISQNKVTFSIKHLEVLPRSIIKNIDEIYEFYGRFQREINALIANLDGRTPANPQVPWRVLHYWDDLLIESSTEGRTVVFTVSNGPGDPRIFLNDLSTLYGWRYERPSFVRAINAFIYEIDRFGRPGISLDP